MTYTELKELIALIDKSSLSSFELEMDNASVKMKKPEPKTQQGKVSQVIPARPANPAPGPVVQAEAGNAPLPLTEAELSGLLDDPSAEERKPGDYVKSPLVGTFYASPSPGKPAFVKAGDKVKKGDVVCIIEAMKVMNEITSEYDGELAEILVENEQIVEYGQDLFRII